MLNSDSVKDKELREAEAVKRALNSNSNRLTKVKAVKYTTIEETVEYLKFEFPDAAFVQIINLDKLDVDGYPETVTRKIREVKVSFNSTNTYSYRGRLTGATVNSVTFQYRIVLAFVKDGLCKSITQKVSSSPRDNYY